MNQIKGEYMTCCRKVMGLLASVDVLADIGFRTNLGDGDNDLSITDVAMQLEDDMAWTAAQLALGMAVARLRRGLEMLRGWPQRAALMSDAESGQGCMDMLRHDFELWEEMKVSDNRLLQAVCKRSCFHTVPVQQLVAICRQSEWRWTPNIAAWISKKHPRFKASQACEDAFKRQRRREARGQNRRERTERNFGVLLEREVLGKVHHFTEVDAQDCHLPYGSSLPSDAYEHKVDTTLPYKQIISYSSGTTWYSPGPDAQAAEHADHGLLRYLKAKGQPQLLENLWLCCFLKVPNLVSAMWLVKALRNNIGCTPLRRSPVLAAWLGR